MTAGGAGDEEQDASSARGHCRRPRTRRRTARRPRQAEADSEGTGEGTPEDGQMSEALASGDLDVGNLPTEEEVELLREITEASRDAADNARGRPIASAGCGNPRPGRLERLCRELEDLRTTARTVTRARRMERPRRPGPENRNKAPEAADAAARQDRGAPAPGEGRPFASGRYLENPPAPRIAHILVTEPQGHPLTADGRVAGRQGAEPFEATGRDANEPWRRFNPNPAAPIM